MAAYTTIDDPEAYFQTKIYTGTGSSLSPTFDGDTDMQPDLVWFKQRSGTQTHYLFDSVRGATERLVPDGTQAEATATDSLTAFNSDGFTVVSDAEVNASTETYVAWCWKAGTSFSNDASATSIGTIDSSGSVNDTAGFSICSFTGTGSNGSIKHGLSTVPNMIITKSRANAENWGVYHQGIGNTHAVYLNSDVAKIDEAAYYQDTTPTSSIFTVGTADATNDAATMIAYCFAPIQGFSKAGAYEANGNADGPFIYTGFRPAWVMIKAVDRAEDWFILDNKRETFNAMTTRLQPNKTNAEDSVATLATDFVSNGIKIRSTTNQYNASGETYVYLAFAEAPFVNSNGVPCNAR